MHTLRVRWENLISCRLISGIKGTIMLGPTAGSQQGKKNREGKMTRISLLLTHDAQPPFKHIVCFIYTCHAGNSWRLSYFFSKGPLIKNP